MPTGPKKKRSGQLRWYRRRTGPSVRGGDGTSALLRGALEVPIPGDKRDVGAERERARKVDGVVSAQLVLLGKLARPLCERPVDPDQHQLALQGLELLPRPPVARGAQPTATTSCSERRATLGVAEDAGRRPKARTPQLGHQLGAGLDNDELDERGGVEVQNQRRCSAMRSETEPRELTRARRELRARAGRVTRPRRTRSSSGSAPSMAESRAIGWPRRVTTTSAPRRARSRCSLNRS